ncbi:MAG: septum formation initiator family protein [Clostridia bacterium]|nr:septum formation initiator family protein [Clostridia bacterium]
MKRRGFLLVKIACVFAFVILVYSIVSQQVNQNKIDNEIADLKQKVVKMADEVDRLKYDLSIQGTEEFYEKYARTHLNYYHYDDEIYITGENN